MLRVLMFHPRPCLSPSMRGREPHEKQCLHGEERRLSDRAVKGAGVLRLLERSETLDGRSGRIRRRVLAGRAEGAQTGRKKEGCFRSRLLLRDGEEFNVVHLREVASWATPPFTTDANELKRWGNRLDVNIQIRSGQAAPNTKEPLSTATARAHTVTTKRSGFAVI